MTNQQLNPFHAYPKFWIILLLIAFIVFATAATGTLTGASVYYQTKTTPIIKNPLAAQTRNLDADTFSVNKILAESIQAPGATPLSISGNAGVLLNSGTSLILQDLSGIGNAYLCIDAKGTVFRNDQPCK